MPAQPESFAIASGEVLSGGRYGFVGDRRISIWGQSNALGVALRSELSAAPLSSDSGLATFNTSGFDRVFVWNGSAYARLVSTNAKNYTTSHLGSEFGVAVRWMRETTSGNLYIDKECADGQSITWFDPVGANYSSIISRRAAADAWLAASGVTVTDSGFVWIQGEADYLQSQSWYQSRLEALLDALLADGVITSATVRALVQMYPTTTHYGAGVAAAKAAVAGSNSGNTSVVGMINSFNADNLHLDAEGQVDIGYNVFGRTFRK